MTGPWYADAAVTVWHGDCLNVLVDMPDCSVDAVVTDPPYGLEFMGKDWDAPWAKGTGLAGNNAGFGEYALADGRTRQARPSYMGGTNPGCLNCGGKKHGIDPTQRKVCICPEPRFQNVTLPRMLAYQAWCTEWATECLRVLKPGGHMLAFGGTRTWHRLTAAIEDAGFEIRDTVADLTGIDAPALLWLYGSGFPKSLDVSKAIDRQAGAQRENTDHNPRAAQQTPKHGTASFGEFDGTPPYLTAPATPEAAQWAGWGTALKPSWEPIVVARKPLAGTVAANVLTWGTGGLNIDATRIEASGRPLRISHNTNTPGKTTYGDNGPGGGSEAAGVTDAGRWPPNAVLGETAADELDQQTGNRPGSHDQQHFSKPDSMFTGARLGVENGHNDSGGGSRFYPVFRYEPKAPRAERPRMPSTEPDDGYATIGKYKTRQCNQCGNRTNPAGGQHSGKPWPVCGHEDWTWVDLIADTGRTTSHPTVKPLDLIRWLVTLVTPPGGLILDPFAGSGTTGEAAIVEGFRAVLIEREADYLPMIRARLSKPIQPVLDLGGGAA